MSRLIPQTLSCLFLTGCSSSPSISVLGAFFPDWMFCILGGIAATVFIHFLLRASGGLRALDKRLLPLIHTALATLAALVIWLIFFKN